MISHSRFSRFLSKWQCWSVHLCPSKSIEKTVFSRLWDSAGEILHTISQCVRTSKSEPLLSVKKHISCSGAFSFQGRLLDSGERSLFYCLFVVPKASLAEVWSAPQDINSFLTEMSIFRCPQHPLCTLDGLLVIHGNIWILSPCQLDCLIDITNVGQH